MKKAYLRPIFDQCSHFIPLMFSKGYKISKMARYRLIISLISARYRLIIFLISENNPQTHRDVFYKKGILRNFAKFTGKHLCQSLFFNKVAGDSGTDVFLWILRNFENTFSYRTSPVAALWYILWNILKLAGRENCDGLRNSFS